MAVSPPALRPRHNGSEDALERGAPPAAAAPRMREAPLLAVCGLCGGAGASTLSYLLARYAVRELDGHVLVCDSGSSGGLAMCAGVQSPRSLSEAAEELAHGLPRAGGLYAVDESASGPQGELRVIATVPRFDGGGDPGGVQALLSLALRAVAARSETTKARRQERLEIRSELGRQDVSEGRVGSGVVAEIRARVQKIRHKAKISRGPDAAFEANPGNPGA